MLLSTTQQAASELANEVSSTASATARRASMLFSASKQRTGKLADKISSAAAAVTTVALLAASHKRIHRETLFHCQRSLVDAQLCFIRLVRLLCLLSGHRPYLLFRYQRLGLKCLLGCCMGSCAVRACCGLSYRRWVLR